MPAAGHVISSMRSITATGTARWWSQQACAFKKRVPWLPDSDGPDRKQICFRVTRSQAGRVLEQNKLRPPKEWSEPKKPQHLVTEFWYMPVSEIHEEGFIQVQTASMVIADSRCRNSVGGELRHERYQKMLKSKGLPWQEIEEHEVYRFGAGEPIVSRTTYLYPVQVHGKCDVIRMSKVGSDGRGCPGLIGPGELNRWNQCLSLDHRKSN